MPNRKKKRASKKAMSSCPCAVHIPRTIVSEGKTIPFIRMVGSADQANTILMAHKPDAQHPDGVMEVATRSFSKETNVIYLGSIELKVAFVFCQVEVRRFNANSMNEWSKWDSCTTDKPRVVGVRDGVAPREVANALTVWPPPKRVVNRFPEPCLRLEDDPISCDPCIANFAFGVSGPDDQPHPICLREVPPGGRIVFLGCCTACRAKKSQMETPEWQPGDDHVYYVFPKEALLEGVCVEDGGGPDMLACVDRAFKSKLPYDNFGAAPVLNTY